MVIGLRMELEPPNWSRASARLEKAPLVRITVDPLPSGSVGRGGMVARSRTRAPTTSRVTPWPFSFRAAFWRLSLGSEGGTGLA